MNYLGTLSVLTAATLLSATPIAALGKDAHPNNLSPKQEETVKMQSWARNSFASISESPNSGDPFIEKGIPFSFIYNKAASSALLPGWKHDSKSTDHDAYSEITTRWSDPATGLTVTAVAKSYKECPAVDWVLYFENNGTKDTPILEDIQAADLTLKTDNGIGVLHTISGDSAGFIGQDSLGSTDIPLYKGYTWRLAPTGGRSSSETASPFFNYDYNGAGLIMAVGWSGQWAAKFDHSSDGPTRIRAGMELTHLLLHPGEKIRTPRILMLRWDGDRTAAHNQFRRLMLDQYAPKPNGKRIDLPFALQPFDRYRLRPGWSTEAGQLEAVKMAHDLGCDSYWLDASWYEGGFPYGAGNWSVDRKAFPNGLKPISDECHKSGMKFILWFEPERVVDNTLIDREHPDWVLKMPNTWGLFDLGNPEARRWITDLISKRIDENGIDIYRQDFNVSPLAYWKQKDTPDRQGISEIRHIEGLYAMWDELLSRHPGLEMDNCASGGRRIDIETAKRAMPLWRSDSGCWDCPTEWYQEQSMGLCQYVPLNTTGIQMYDAYTFRSAATGGAIAAFGYLEPDFNKDAARKSLEEAKENAPYWYGDYYPLTSANISTDHFVAWQLDRRDLDAGIVLAFRRENCNTDALKIKLRGIEEDHKYRVDFIDDARKKTSKTVSGKDLSEKGLTISLLKHASLLIRYRAIEAAK